jgi:hypothetical protein
MAYSSSVSNFCQTLLGQDLREVASQESRIVFKQLGDVRYERFWSVWEYAFLIVWRIILVSVFGACADYYAPSHFTVSFT